MASASSVLLMLAACSETVLLTNEITQKSPATPTLAKLAKVETQPNILWIITDDQRADSIAAFNQSQRGSRDSALGFVSSPNIDNLAAEGVMFTHAYTNSPACAPSRSSMQFGLYPHHSGRFGFEYYHNQHDLKLKTTSMTLSDKGYQTALFGKRGVRLKQLTDGALRREVPIYDQKIDYHHDLAFKHFTDFARIDTRNNGKVTGSDEHFVFPDGRVEILDQSKIDKLNKSAIEKELDILRSYTRSQELLIIGGVSPQPAGETLDGHILKSFLQYLDNPNSEYNTPFNKTLTGPNSAKPQMLNLGFHFPHTPVLPPKSFRDQFKGKNYQVPEFSTAEVEKLPDQLRKLYQNLKIDGLTPAEKQQAIADYYAFCAYGDYLIGQAVAGFKKYSEAQGREYIILLTVGDHGWQLGEQGIEAKFSPWNSSNQGIVIAVDSTHQRFPPGLVVNDFVEYVDIAPTLLAASGVDVKQEKPQLDGFDLAEVIRDKSLKRDYVIAELNAIIGPRAYLRSEDFAFSMRVREQNGFPGQHYAPGENLDWAYRTSVENLEMALYDLRCDVNEQNNIAYQAEYQKVTDYFRKKLTDIVIGDGRVEVDWSEPNKYSVSDFALGAHDKKLSGLAKITLPTCINKP